MQNNKAKDKLKKNMIMFGKVAMPTMFSATSPDFHYEIADVLMNWKYKQINIIAPRGHAKSSIVGGVFPLYHLMFDKGRKLIVLISRTQDHAVKLLGTLKDVLDYSQSFRSIFGYWGQHSAKQWAKHQVELKDSSMIICKGTGQQLRGIKVGNQRPTLIIVDDPEDENNTKTSEAMEQNLRWLLQSAIPSLDPMRGRIAVIGTPQHQRCMVETLKEMKGWKNMLFKPDMAKKIALWESWQPIAKLIEKKKELESINRASVFYREYLCEIVGDEDQLFKESYLKIYEGSIEKNDSGESFLHLTERNGKVVDETLPVNIFMGVDPASSTKQTADYSTIVSVAVDEHNNRYVLPYFQKRVSPMKLADSIIRQFKLYEPSKTRIETVGYQEMLRDYLKTRCEEEGLFISGLEIRENPRTSKSSRLETLEPSFAQGKVFIKDDMESLKDELLLYPRGKHDDLLDGLYYATKKVYIPHHKSSDLVKNNEYRENTIYEDSWLIA
jgi:predicted phage terminase large subunit-like protein